MGDQDQQGADNPPVEERKSTAPEFGVFQPELEEPCQLSTVKIDFSTSSMPIVTVNDINNRTEHTWNLDYSNYVSRKTTIGSNVREDQLVHPGSANKKLEKLINYLCARNNAKLDNVTVGGAVLRIKLNGVFNTKQLTILFNDRMNSVDPYIQFVDNSSLDMISFFYNGDNLEKIGHVLSHEIISAYKLDLHMEDLGDTSFICSVRSPCVRLHLRKSVTFLELQLLAFSYGLNNPVGSNLEIITLGTDFSSFFEYLKGEGWHEKVVGDKLYTSYPVNGNDINLHTILNFKCLSVQVINQGDGRDIDMQTSPKQDDTSAIVKMPYKKRLKLEKKSPWLKSVARHFDRALFDFDEKAAMLETDVVLDQHEDFDFWVHKLLRNEGTSINYLTIKGMSKFFGFCPPIKVCELTLIYNDVYPKNFFVPLLWNKLKKLTVSTDKCVVNANIMVGSAEQRFKLHTQLQK